MRLEMMEEQDDVVIGDGSPRGVSKRRANKHLIERRRRARINCSLTQLKSLVLEGMKKDPARYNRLEKADILEMTVTHLRTVKNQQSPDSGDSLLSARYKAGFKECATEISNFLTGLPGMEDKVKENILSHVSDCLQRVKSTQESASDNQSITGSPNSAMLGNCATYGETMVDLSEPLDLSRTGTKRLESAEEMECYTIQKYGSDAESVSSSSGHDCDLSINNCLSPPDMQITHDVRQGCGESVDSGVDDDVSSNEDQQVSQGINKTDGVDHDQRVDLYPGEDGEMRLADGSMWRPW